MEKADITPALVSKLVATQFPNWADLAVRPVELDGWDNTTFRLGGDLAVRLPSAEAYVPQIEKEHLWLPVLAAQLPLPIPEPVARGEPGCGFPRPWSVYRWLDGEHASVERVPDLERFAGDLGGFLSALYEVDSAGGPPAGEHSFFRGGPLATYDAETRAAISTLASELDAPLATAVWDGALAAEWRDAPVWVHGDVTPANLLVVNGAMSAVIDFGCSAVGDPACDLTIAWTFFFDDSRAAFRERLALDDRAWARGRGWALWKALITLAQARHEGRDTELTGARFGWRVGPRQVLAQVVDDHKQLG